MTPVKNSSAEGFMQMALDLAEKARGTTFPNPPVGAVLVKEGKVISRGCTQVYGSHHAEVMAIRGAGRRAQGSTLYVTLEPCSHFGKTPPCSELIIQSKLKQVYVGTTDPNQIVKGKGIRSLQKAGIQVTRNILAQKIREFYRNYFFVLKHGRPFITLKVAQSLEGSINSAPGQRTAISHPESQHYTHELRNRCDAILIGGNTLRCDDPDLTPRTISSRKRKYPECLVISRSAQFVPSYKLLQLGRKSKTIIITSGLRSLSVIPGIEKIKIPRVSKHLIKTLMEFLIQRGYHSVLVEAGPEILSKWVKSKLWDSLHVIASPKSFPKGQKWTANLPLNWQENLKIGKFTRLKEDCIWEFLPKK